MTGKGISHFEECAQVFENACTSILLPYCRNKRKAFRIIQQYPVELLMEKYMPHETLLVKNVFSVLLTLFITVFSKDI